MKKRKFENFSDFVTRAMYFIVKLFIGEQRKQEILQKKKCKRVRKFGPEILKTFKEIAEANGLKYSPTFGTLLGAYREHGFIKHDDDIDIAYDLNTMSYKLLIDLGNAGFEMTKFFVSDDKNCVHFAFEKYNVKFDLYSFEIKNGYVILSAPSDEKNAVERCGETDIFIIERAVFEFKGYSEDDALCKSLSVFSNPQEILEVIYGPNFMTPVKNAHTGVVSDKYRIVPIEESYYNLYLKPDVVKLLSNEQYYTKYTQK